MLVLLSPVTVVCDQVNPEVLWQQRLQQFTRWALCLSELLLSQVRSVGSCPSLYFFLLALPHPPCSQSWKSWSSCQHFQATCPKSSTAQQLLQQLHHTGLGCDAKSPCNVWQYKLSCWRWAIKLLLSSFSLCLFDFLVTEKVGISDLKAPKAKSQKKQRLFMNQVKLSHSKGRIWKGADLHFSVSLFHSP